MSDGPGRPAARSMTAEGVLALLARMRDAGVTAWIDGGWGVDALVGFQSRPHQDLDLVVALDDVPAIEAALGPRGFLRTEDQLPVRFVLGHDALGSIDFHTVCFDAEGGGLQPQPGGGTFRYPPEGFTTGRIAGEEVPCISAAVQILCHLGYAPSEKDLHDVRLLHRELGVPLPAPYRSRESGRENPR
jgi:lincosamide nucleotidyltransferase A/C/D/E